MQSPGDEIDAGDVWYYARNNEPEGPITDADFSLLVNAGIIKPETMVWRPGMPDWVRYRSIARLAHVPPQPPPPPPPGADVPWIGPRYTDPEPAPGVRFAGFWIRAAAKILDALILYALVAVTWRILAPGGFILTALLPAAYTTFFVGRFGCTPGKIAFNLRVVRADGTRVDYGLALGRWCAEWLSRLVFGVGYLLAAFDGQKRALHDHICGTRVIYSRPPQG